MEQKTINIKDHKITFFVTDSIFNIKLGGVEISGQADSIYKFVKKLNIKNNWVPFGYNLEMIYKPKNSKNISAFLYRFK